MISRVIQSLLACCLISALFLSSGCTARARAERHLKRGNEFFAKGDSEKAKIEYLNAIRKGVRDPQAMIRLGEMFLKGGDIQQAAQYLIMASNAEPTNNTVHRDLASIFAAYGAPAKAHEQAEAILKTEPTDPQALVVLAQTSSEKEQVDKARQRLLELQRSSPQNATVLFCLGVLAQNSRELPAALNYYKQAVTLNPKDGRFHLALADVASATGDNVTAESYYKSAVALAPVKSWDRLRYAEFLNRQQRAEEAEKLLEETVTKAPDFARALNLLTDILLGRNKVAEAEKRCEQAMALAPNQRDALLNRARIKLAKRDLPGASKELEELTKAYPRDSMVHYTYATALVDSFESEKALASLGTAVALDPRNLQAVILRSELLLQRNSANEAIADLTRISKEYPTQTSIFYMLARAYRQRRNFDEALNIYNQLIKALPSDPRPLYFMGQAYREMNNPVEARSAFNSALMVNPEFAQAVEELTNLDIIEKKLDSAMARLRPFLQKYPEKPFLLLLVAKVYAAQGKTDDAFSSLQKAVEIAPDYYIAQRALADLYSYTGKRDEAIRRYTELVKKSPRDTGAAIQLGLLQEAAKDYRGARATYEGLLEVLPNYAIALNNLANLLAEHLGETEKAFEYSRRAREIAPQQPAIADTFGWGLWRRGEYARAVTVLEEGINKLADFPEAQYHMGMAYYMMGAEKPALAALEIAAQSKSDFTGKERAQSALETLKINPAAARPETVQALQKSVKERPTDLMARLRLAQIFDNQKQWDNASQNYQEVLRINAACTNALFRLIDLNFSLGYPQRGLDLAKQAWTMAPDGNLAAYLGPLGYSAGDFKWAGAVLAEARRARPDSGRIIFFQAANSYALGDLRRARDLFEESGKATKEPMPLSKLAVSLVNFQLESKFPSNAAAVVAEALKLDAKFPPALVVGGLGAEAAGDFPGARSRYEAVLAAFPSHVIGQRQLGLLLAEKLSNDDKAAQLLGDVRRELPADTQLTKAMGKISYRRSDYKEAARLLGEAAVTLPKDADLLYYLGISQYHLNDREAKTSLTEALKLDPKSELSKSAEKIVAELK